MSIIKIALLASIASAAAVSAPSFAQDAGRANLYGGGASLPAPYVRQAEDCYGKKLPLLVYNGGNAPLTVNSAPFIFTNSARPADNFNCTAGANPPYPNTSLWYISTGSGRGIAAFVSRDPNFFGPVNADTTSRWPEVDYAVSETSLGATQVTIYNGALRDASNNPIAGTIGSGATAVTIAPTGTAPAAGQVQTPLDRNGAIVQVPALVAPVTIAYDPRYKSSFDGRFYTLNLKYPVKSTIAGVSTVTGGLRLDQNAYCKIFNGLITNLNDPALKTLNGNITLRNVNDKAGFTTAAAADAAFSVPLQITGRSDSSGTTSLWTRHLAAACASVAGNQYADSTSTLPTSLQGGFFNKAAAQVTTPEVIGKYTLADQSDGVAQALSSRYASTVDNRFRIGYVGPDYVLPYVLSTITNNYGLYTAALATTRTTGTTVTTVFVSPTPTSAAAAFATQQPPQSKSATDGTYVAANTAQGLRSDPAAWVSPASKTAPLAYPVNAAGTAYPIVGTSNWLYYTCYASAARRDTVKDFLTFYYTRPFISSTSPAGLLASAGFAPVPRAFVTAITQTFVTPVAATAGLNLQISNGGQGTQCAGRPGAGA